MADAIIDLVGPEDLPLICALYNQIFRPARDVESFHRRFRGRYNVLMLVARVDEKPTGFFLGFELKPTVYFAWFYGVVPECRRLGVATQLMDAVHSWAKQNEYESIRFECHNQHRPMLHLAIALGYDIVGIRWDPDRGDNLVIFEKVLTHQVLDMRQVAKGVWLLRGFPPNMFNVYLMEDVLVDAATRWARGRILSQLRRHRPRLVALTHCHPDHQGVARLACRQYKIPLACHAHDVPAMEGRAPMLPANWVMRLGMRVWAGPPAPVTRVLHDGDEVAGFRVVHTPGHTPGHIVYFRESDRVAVAGDVLANISFLSFQPGLRTPPSFFSANAAQNRESIRKLVALRPSIVCFGHGPPLYHTELLEKLVERIDART